MADLTDLPHLIQLLDDESPQIRKAVLEALHDLGSQLDIELEKKPELLNPVQREHLQNVLAHLKDPPLPNIRFAPEVSKEITKFQIGEMVKHKRYGYRGVIVDYDRICQADEIWYYGNRYQPRRNQPWYHILVHQSNQTTYAAQSSLTWDTSLQQIQHPLLRYFFHHFENGRYERNNEPWPYRWNISKNDQNT
ncbi:MAG: heat shock protein HspQ [Gemmatimonadetes bacterium]|nr:MAG: heat shock protein HspQ [Gemmatimonadota bacterium]